MSPHMNVEALLRVCMRMSSPGMNVQVSWNQLKSVGKPVHNLPAVSKATLDSVTRIIGYEFKDPRLLALALVSEYPVRNTRQLTTGKTDCCSLMQANPVCIQLMLTRRSGGWEMPYTAIVSSVNRWRTQRSHLRILTYRRHNLRRETRAVEKAKSR